MFCRSCRSLDLGFSQTTKHTTSEREHHSTLSQLHVAASQGCELCLEIWRHFNMQFDENWKLLDAHRKRDAALPATSDDHKASSIMGLMKIFPRVESPVLYRFQHDSRFMRQGSENSQGYSHILFYHQHLKLTPIKFGLYASEDSTAAMTKRVSGRPIISSVGQEGNFALVRRWYQDCLQNHTASCSSSITALLPARLLDVRKLEDSEDVRLYLSHKGEVGSWIALSHCWGTETPQLIAKTTNVDSLVTRTPFKDLPKTFSDAVLVARKLGFRFLWIDSLCILQDSEQDWLVESQKMQDYYKNCALSIAADRSGSDLLGFLRPNIVDGEGFKDLTLQSAGTRHQGVFCDGCYSDSEELAQFGPMRFLFDPPTKVPKSVNLVPMGKYGSLYTPPPLETNIVGDRYQCTVCRNTDFCAGCRINPSNPHDESHELIKIEDWNDKDAVSIRPLSKDPCLEQPLRTRAWVLQEDILAPRTIRYTSSELVWECHCGRILEHDCQVMRYNKPTLRSAFVPDPSIQLKIGKILSDEVSLEEALRWWYFAVSNFASRSITYVSDRLPAISGLAREMSRGTHKLTYRAGIWEENIISGLLWNSFGNATVSNTYCAPSWSWASLEFHSYDNIYQSRVYLIEGDLKPKAEIVSCDVEVRDGDIYGRVRSACLEIRGPWLPITGRDIEVVFTRWNHYDTDQAKYAKKVDKLILSLDQHWEPDDEDALLQKRLSLIWMTLQDPSNYAYALVLQPFEEDQNIFQRVGIARIMVPNNPDLNWTLRTLKIK